MIWCRNIYLYTSHQKKKFSLFRLFILKTHLIFWPSTLYILRNWQKKTHFRRFFIHFSLTKLTHAPEMVQNSPLTHIMDFFTSFISSPNYIKNPHLRTKIVETLSLLTPKRFKSEITPSPFSSELSVKGLGPALIHFFVDVETTGGNYWFIFLTGRRHLRGKHVYRFLSRVVASSQFFSRDASI